MDAAAQYQFLIRVSGVPGFFVSRTGADVSANVQKVYDGGAMWPDTVSGRPEVANVVVSRNFDPERDGPVLSQYLPVVGRWTTSLTVIPTDADLVPTGPARTYPMAKLTRIGEPGANANSNDPSTYELEFVVTRAT